MDSAQMGNPISTITVAIVEPEFPLNVGYIARAMTNFAIRRLTIVSQHRMTQTSKNEAAKFASHGSDVVANIRYVRSLHELKKSFNLLIGTTAITAKRKSNITRKTLDAEECVRAVHSYSSNLENVCIVFGRDTTGLTNAELEQCDYVLTIRAGANYSTLNISHAAAIVFYLFHREFVSTNKQGGHGRTAFAGRPERERLIALFKDLALLSDFQEFKQRRLGEALNRLLNRSNPSLRELYLLMGLASKAKTKITTLESKKQSRH